jgi:putative transposase
MFRKEVWTFRGLTTAFVFFVIHLQSRRVLLSRATFSPTHRWIRQQIRHALWACDDQQIEPRFFLRDNDVLYPDDLDVILRHSGIETVRTPFGAPNANAHSERFVQSSKRECLDHMLVFGLSRLQYLLDCYSLFYNEHRPHQGINNEIPLRRCMTDPRREGRVLSNAVAGTIARKDFLGGLLKSYQRAA